MYSNRVHISILMLILGATNFYGVVTLVKIETNMGF